MIVGGVVAVCLGGWLALERRRVEFDRRATASGLYHEGCTWFGISCSHRSKTCTSFRTLAMEHPDGLHYHEIRWDAPHEEEQDDWVAFQDAMDDKYSRASQRPWLPVVADPPEPLCPIAADPP